jgi:PTH2 family peptidyl-tRNA hydrolase
MPVKQVIVWRNDLACRAGKKMAQSGHAALADLSNAIRDNVDAEGNVSFKLTPAQKEWYTTNFRKIVLRVDSEADLLVIYERAKELGLPTELVIDSGLTEWKEPTKTCLAIGPAEESKIDEVTGESGPLGRLKLM